MSEAAVSTALPKEAIDAVKNAYVRTLQSIDAVVPQSKLGAVENPTGKYIQAEVRFEGSVPLVVTLVLPDKSAVTLAKTFTRCPIDFEHETMDDVVGEFLNVLGGEIETALQENGIDANASLPKTSRAFSEDGQERITQINFSSADGPCWIWVGVPRA